MDYAANTPVDPDVMSCFIEESNRYIANPNSNHFMGREAKERMDHISEHIKELLNNKSSEIIFTSGASEANNLALKGLVHAYRHNGKHIISTCMEHPSVSGALTYLQSLGYEIDLVDIKSDGQIDIEHLKALLRKDTVLVSICYVDSELGIRQPIEEISNILKDYPNCYFHTDATQAIGKIPVHSELSDCFTFTPHKFFGMNGCGVLVKKKDIVLEPLFHGGSSTTIYRSGTPSLALAASIDKALEVSLSNLEERYLYCKSINDNIKNNLLQYKRVRINSTHHSVPHIINLSVQGTKATAFTNVLEQEGICVSVKSACSVSGAPSRPVYAVTRDKKNAMSSFRLSISHLTTGEEVALFLAAFDRCYMKLTSS